MRLILKAAERRDRATRARRCCAMFAALALLVGCGSAGATSTSASADRPTVAVTTAILGDVVENLAGDHFDVVTIMPNGADPHRFQPSAQQIAILGDATAIIANGGGFEEGLLDAIEAAESDGIAVFEALTAIEPLAFDGGHHHHDEDDHDEEGHDEEHGEGDYAEDHDEEHGEDDHDHADEGAVSDPHFFTDPARMAIVADAIVDFLDEQGTDEIDSQAFRSDASPYVEELEALDAEIEQTLAGIEEPRRQFVTTHPALNYFADRYEFDVVGNASAGGDASGASGRELAELAETMATEQISVVFTDSSGSNSIAQTVADEVGDVALVELYSESLGPADSTASTYVDMVRTNASRIAAALQQ